MSPIQRTISRLPIRLVVAAAATIALSLSGSAQQPTEPRGLAASGQAPVYLALGDSYPYGSGGSGTVPQNDNYWVGYPELLNALLDRPTVNAGCPGETTTSFLTGAAVDSPHCVEVKDAGLLHVDYTGSQMEFAESYLATHDRVVLVTVQLGGPDFRNFTRQCNNSLPCIMANLAAFEAGLAANFDTILSRIRNAGYTGPLIVVEYPATDFHTPAAQLQVHTYQAVLPAVQAYGGVMAPVYDRFRIEAEPFGGDSCAAGLLITNTDGTCNIHPTAYGHQLIAAVIAEMVGASATR